MDHLQRYCDGDGKPFACGSAAHCEKASDEAGLGLWEYAVRIA